jgi:hypothetical protein
MRDGAILAMQRANVKRDGVMIAQHQLLRSTQEATEIVLAGSTLWQRMRWLLWPEQYVAAVHAVALHLIDEAKAEMADTAAKAKIVKPELVGVPGTGLAAKEILRG